MNSFLQTHQDISRYVDYNKIMHCHGHIYNYAPDAIVVSTLDQIFKNNEKQISEEETEIKKAS
jgi:hypothetical protein